MSTTPDADLTAAIAHIARTTPLSALDLAPLVRAIRHSIAADLESSDLAMTDPYDQGAGLLIELDEAVRIVRGDEPPTRRNSPSG